MVDDFEPAFQKKLLTPLLAVGYKVALYADNGGTERTQSGYSRQAVTFMVSSIPPILARNSNTLIFGPAGVSWPQVTHIGLFDSTGVLMFKRKLLIPLTKGAGETLVVAIGALEIGYV